MVQPTRRVPTIRVIVVASERQLIERVKLLLADSFPIEVVGEASDLRQCFSAASELRGRVVLIADTDARLPALEVSRNLNTSLPGLATVIMSPREDTDYFRRVIASGARGLVPIPPSLEALVSAITDAYEVSGGRGRLPAEAVERSRDGARIIAVHGPKGGVGKSLIATNLAVLVARENPGLRTILLDFDFQFGDVPLLLDMHPEHSISDLLPVVYELRPDALNRVVALHSSGLRVLAPPRLEEADRIDDRHVRLILAAVRANFDVIIIDCSSALSEATLCALELADRILEVCNPDVLSLRETAAMLELLKSLGIADETIGLVLNRVSKRLEIQPEDIRRLFSYQVLAEVPADFIGIEASINAGTPAAVAAPTLPLVASLRGLLQKLELVPAAAPASRGRRRLGRTPRL